MPALAGAHRARVVCRAAGQCDWRERSDTSVRRRGGRACFLSGQADPHLHHGQPKAAATTLTRARSADFSSASSAPGDPDQRAAAAA